MALRDADRRLVEAVFLEYLSRWNARDVDGCVALFAPAGDLLTPNGLFLNKAELRAHYEKVFRQAYRDHRALKPRILEVRSVVEDQAVILDAQWETHRVETSGEMIELVAEAHGTCVFVKAQRRWRIQALRIMFPVMGAPNFS